MTKRSTRTPGASLAGLRRCLRRSSRLRSSSRALQAEIERVERGIEGSTASLGGWKRGVALDTLVRLCVCSKGHKLNHRSQSDPAEQIPSSQSPSSPSSSSSSARHRLHDSLTSTPARGTSCTRPRHRLPCPTSLARKAKSSAWSLLRKSRLFPTDPSSSPLYSVGYFPNWAIYARN